MAALGLCCCVQAFSRYGYWELLFIAMCGLLVAMASLVANHGLQVCWLQKLYLQCPGLVAPWHVGTSQTRDRTHVLCIGRRTFNHWTTREVHFHKIL